MVYWSLKFLSVPLIRVYYVRISFLALCCAYGHVLRCSDIYGHMMSCAGIG